MTDTEQLAQKPNQEMLRFIEWIVERSEEELGHIGLTSRTISMLNAFVEDGHRLLAATIHGQEA